MQKAPQAWQRGHYSSSRPCRLHLGPPLLAHLRPPSSCRGAAASSRPPREPPCRAARRHLPPATEPRPHCVPGAVVLCPPLNPFFFFFFNVPARWHWGAAQSQLRPHAVWWRSGGGGSVLSCPHVTAPRGWKRPPSSPRPTAPYPQDHPPQSAAHPKKWHVWVVQGPCWPWASAS